MPSDQCNQWPRWAREKQARIAAHLAEGQGTTRQLLCRWSCHVFLPPMRQGHVPVISTFKVLLGIECSVSTWAQFVYSFSCWNVDFLLSWRIKIRHVESIFWRNELENDTWNCWKTPHQIISSYRQKKLRGRKLFFVLVFILVFKIFIKQLWFTNRFYFCMSKEFRWRNIFKNNLKLILKAS